jgi:hypothetical protein
MEISPSTTLLRSTDIVLKSDGMATFSASSQRLVLRANQEKRTVRSGVSTSRDLARDCSYGNATLMVPNKE